MTVRWTVRAANVFVAETESRSVCYNLFKTKGVEEI